VIAIGCIADDFTGGTDVAAALRRSGMTVTLLFDVPDAGTDVPASDAVVIALKTRTVAPDVAVRQSLDALDWLRARQVERVYFKYCSTFDSTDDGNIGPVTDALLTALGESTTIICPASPEHGRTMYRGHLFVHDQLLSESSMRHHPLTPMTDPDIVAVLGRQAEGAVGRLSLLTVREGVEATGAAIKELRAAGVQHVVTDAIDQSDLHTVAEASASLRLLTGGAGLAGALGEVVADGSDRPAARAELLPEGPSVVLAGSCSAATLAQVAKAAAAMPAYRLDPAVTPDPTQLLDDATRWLEAHVSDGPVLVYSSAGPEDRERARAAMGPRTAEILEDTLAALGSSAVRLGATRLVVAGGETSGAVVQALGVRSVVVESEADRGVPWCRTIDEPAVALLLKSGNFGSEDLLLRAAGGAG
jgi:uncharacterized protein YgbK (DUF1537 family)